MSRFLQPACAQRPALFGRLIAGARRALPRIGKGQQMSEPPLAYDESTLARMVEGYQQLVARLGACRDSDEHEALRDALRAHLEALWPILQAIVQPLAWGWVQRNLTDLGGSRGLRDAHEGVITSMCMHILDTLAARPIAPGPQLTPLLRRIARNRMVDELRHSQRHSPDHPAPAAAPAAATAAAPIPLDEAVLGAHPELSLDLSSQLDDRLYRHECLAAIDEYWQLRLSPDETRIVAERMRDPATPYDSIAALFTPPWSPEAVRKRYSRIIADTRAHLRALDLLPVPHECD
ncbi:MAG: hypothetical protein HGA45_04255 [Chloroflexales bacterium]|nr:hypothetical protein [Chloroflexales bacterium]